MASLYEIRAQVAEQRRLNNELSAELATIINSIQAAYNKWNNLCERISGTLNEGVNRVNRSQQAIDASYQMQGEIDRMYVLFKNIEEANKKIRECNNKKIYDFANYSAVRKIVSAILDNIENNFVSDAVITKSIEVKHLQLPDYWLTCALLSIMAWRNDNRQLANQALERACKLDKKETAVFFLAFNLRMGRESAAVKWFDYYTGCDLYGEDDRTFMLLFSIVNRVITENCSDEVVSKVSSYINRVISDDLNRNGYNEEFLINRISGYLRRFVPNEALPYPVLMKHCTEQSYLTSEMMLAKANVNILDFILKTVNISEKERKDYLNAFIEQTVKKPNKVEIEVDDEIKYNELIIRHQGDIEAAKAEFESLRTHRENDFDIIVEMVDWVYKPGSDDEVNPSVRLNMFSFTKDLAAKSVQRHFENYRRQFKNTYNIQINDYQTVADLTNEAGECAKLRSFVEEKKNAALSGVKTWASFIGFGLGAAAAVAAILTMMLGLLALTVIGIVFGVAYLLVCSSRKKAINRDFDNEYALSEQVLKSIFAEYALYVRQFREYDAYSEKIMEEFSKA